MTKNVYGEFIQVKSDAKRLFKCYATEKNSLLLQYFGANSTSSVCINEIYSY